MRIHLSALGCRLNEAELEQWAQRFHSRGHAVVDTPEAADLTVVNTCAVTAEAVRKSRRSVRQLQRQNPRAKLVVSGCYATLQPDEAAGLLGVDLVVANADKDRLVDLAHEVLALPSVAAAAAEPQANALFARRRSRAFVKVQDGCRYRCTFCIVTVARGGERSRTMAAIVDEVNRLQGQGVQEVVLTGVHLGGYGSDSGSDLAALIETLLRETDMPRLRLGSLEPWELSERFFALFEAPRLMPHLHLPLQSGSDKILRKMARRCRTDDFARLVEQARTAIADCHLSTDLIAGFPGEGEAEWRETLDFVAAVGFGHLHIFPYSPRENTPAARFPEQVDGPTKRQRVRTLGKLAREMKRITLNAYLGRSFPVLWESKTRRLDDGRIVYFGYTPNYLRVAVATAQADLTNRIAPARLLHLDESGGWVWTQLVEDD